MAMEINANGFPVRIQKFSDFVDEKAETVVEKADVETPTTVGTVNGPVTWWQLIGGWMSDAPIFLLAALPLIATWLQSSAPITTRGLITVGILAIVAGLTGVQRLTGTDGLSLRLRATGQINGGK